MVWNNNNNMKFVEIMIENDIINDIRDKKSFVILSWFLEINDNVSSVHK